MMYHRSKQLGTVVLSVNMTGESICVDFFKRLDGSFGFEEYRRDVETAEGWFPIGFYSDQTFDSLEAAQTAAIMTVGWFDSEI